MTRARDQRSTRRRLNVLAASVLVAFGALPAYALDPTALPTGGQVAAGSAAISQSGAHMDVNQATQRAIINWSTFNIGSAASVNFAQPSASAVVLNRVTSSSGGSEILGRMSANGQVFLVNPSGVLFGKTAQVDVGAMVATSLNISDANFLAGRYTFARTGSAGSVVNEGTLRAADGGYIALLAPEVRNQGLIAARLGTVALAAGNKVTLDFAGDRLVSLAIDESALKALVENHGVVQAAGGTVILAARAAGDLASTVVNNAGLIQATSVSERDGVIRLEGGERGVVAVSGTLDASGRGAGEHGGTIKVLGEKVRLSSGATLDATGDAGGGTVLVGGNYQGSGPEQDASTTSVARGAQIKADALNSGDGGKVILWSNEYTEFEGAVSARGGANGGNGGFVETSSHGVLSASGTVNTLAPLGAAGLWLLDPTDITITTTADAFVTGVTPFHPTASGSVLTWATIDNALAGGNVKVQTTTGFDAGQSGNITIANGFAYNRANALTLTAANNITVNGAVTNSGAGALTLTAGGAGSVAVNQNLTTTGGTIAINAGTGGVSLAAATSINAGSGLVAIDAGGGAASFSTGTLQTSNATTSAIGITNASTLTLGNVSLTGGGTLTVSHSGAGTQTAGTVISGAGGGLTKAGAGTLTLSQANTYTGLTTVSGGTLAEGASNVIASGAVTVSGGTYDMATFTDTVGAVTLASGSIAGGAGGTLTGTSYTVQSGTISAVLAGAVNLTKTTSGMVTLSRANTYSGVTTINAGTLSVSSLANGGVASNIGASAAGAANLVLGGGSLQYTGATVASNRGFTLTAGTDSSIDVTVGANALTFSGASAATSGALSKVGSGTLTLSGANTYTGGTTIKAGTLNGTVATAFGTGTVTIGDSSGAVNATLNGGLAGTFANAIAVSGGGTNAITSTAASIFSGSVVLNNQNLTVQTSGSNLTLSGGVTGAGNLTLNTTAAAGTITLSAAVAGTQVNNAGTVTNSGTGAAGSTISAVVGANVTGITESSATSALTVSGLLNTSSTATTLTNSGGALFTVSGGVAGTAGNLTLNNNSSLANGITLSTAAVNNIGTITNSGTGTGNSLVSVGIGTNVTGVTQNSATSGLTLSAANTYTGTTTITSGTLRLGIANAIGASSAVTANGALDMAGFADTIGSLAGSGTVTNSGGVAATLTTGGSNASTTFSGVIQDGTSAITLAKAGTGTFTLSGANTYTGATAVNAGILVASNASALGSTVGGTTVAAGATLNINNVAIGAENITSLSGVGVGSAGALTGTGSASLSGLVTMAVASTIGTANGGDSLALSGVVSGAFALTKVGAGTLNLSGTNTYSGATNVSGGTLTLSGASGSATASAFTVNAGATLTLDNTAANNTNRLGDALALTMTGGELVFKGTNVAATNASETIGALTPTSGASTVTAVSGTGGSTVLTFASAARSAGATVLFRGDSLGSTPGAGVSNIVFTAAGGLGLTGGNTTAVNKTIVPWAIGDTSSAGTGGGFVTHNVNLANNLANTNGIRPLDLATEYTTATGVAGVNLKVTASVSPNVSQTYNSMLLSGGFTYTIGSGGGAKTATITSGAIYSTGGANTITGRAATDILAFGAVEAKVSTSSDLTFGTNLVTGTAGLTKSDSGVLLESAATGFTGGIFVNGGTLRSGIASAFTSQAVTVRAAGTLDLNGNSNTFSALTMESGPSSGAAVTTGAGTLTLAGNVTLNAVGSGATGATISGQLDNGGATRTFTVNSGLATDDLAVSAVISGAGGLSKAGAGQLTLSGANSYTGVTTVTAGTLSFNSIANVSGGNSALGAPTTVANGTIALAGGATLQYTGSGSSSNRVVNLTSTGGIVDASGTGNLALSGGITAGGNFNLTLTGTGTGTESGVIATGSGTLTKSGTGTWTLSNTNTYTGATTISAGSLVATADGALGTAAAGTTVASGATLGFSGGFNYATAEAVNISGTGDAGNGRAGAVDNISGANTFAGAITQGALATTAVTAGGLTLSGNFVNGGFLATFNTNANTIAANGVMSGAGGLIKNGSGTLTLGNAANTYTGQTTINNGTLSVGTLALGGVNSSLGATAASTPILIGSATSATLSYTGGVVTTDRLITIRGTGGGTIQSTANTLTLSGQIRNNGNPLTFDTNTGNIIVSGLISGPGNLIKTGTGTLTLSSGDTYLGSTSINVGTLLLGATNAIGSRSAVTVGGSGTLDLGGFNDTVGSITGAGTITSSVAAAVTLTEGGDNSSTTFSGVIQNGSGTVALAKAGTGTLTLSGANTYSGGTTIKAGTLRGTTNATAFGGGTITIGDASGSANATLNGGFSGTFTNAISVAAGNTGTATITDSANSTFSGAVTLNNHDLTLTSSANTLTMSGGVAGTGNLTLSATGPNAITLSTAAVNNTGTITNSGAGSATDLISAAIGTNVTGVTENSATSALALGGANTYTSATTISAGTLQLSAANAIGSGSDVTVAGAGTLDLGGFSDTIKSLSGSGTVTSSAAGAVTLTTGSIGSTTFTGLIQNGSGTVGLAKQGSGTFTLSGANTYSGATTINNGTLSVSSLANGGAASNIGAASSVAASLVLGGGSLQYTGGTTSIDRSFTLTAGTASVIDVINGAANLTITGAGAATTGALTKMGSGTLTLTGASAYSGASAVNWGTLAVSGASGAAGTGTIRVAGATTLDIINGATVANAVTVNAGTIGNSAGAATLSTGGVTLLADSFVSSTGTGLGIGAVIADSASTFGITKQGASTVTLSGNNTYKGTTTVSTGTLVAANAGALGTTASGTSVTSGATLEIANAAIGAEAVTLNGTGVGGAGALTGTGTASLSGPVILATDSRIGVTGGNSLSLSGTVEGPGALEILGGGAVTLGSTVGSSTALASFSGAAGTTLPINGGLVRTTGAQTYDGPTTFGLATTLQTTAGGSIGGSGAITATAGILSLDAGVGNVAFGNGSNNFGTVAVTSGNNVSLTDANAIQFGGASTVSGGLTVNAVGITEAVGASVAVTGLSVFNAGAGPITLANAGNDFGGAVSLNNSGANSASVIDTNALTLGASTIGQNLSAVAGGRLTLAGTLTTGGSSGTSIELVGQSFTNAAGAAALAPGAGSRFLVWSSNANPFGGGSPDDRGGLAYDFKQYDATYGVTTVAGSGNGFLYTLPPTITPSLGGTATKVYDGATSAPTGSLTLSPSAGVVDGDTVGLALTGATYDTRDAGTGKTVTASGISASATNGAATVYGYQASPTSASAVVGTITAAPLTVSAQTDSRGYNGTTSSSVAPVVTGTLYDAVGTAATQSYDSKNVGTTHVLSASGLGVNDGNAGANYSISYLPSAATGVITAAPLTVSADNETRAQATPNPPFTAIYSGFQGGDSSSSLGGTLVLATPATILSPAGAYPITPSGLTSGNYVMVFIDGVLTVTAGTVTPPPVSIAAATGAIASTINPPGAAPAGITAPFSAESIIVMMAAGGGSATVEQISPTISIVNCGIRSPVNRAARPNETCKTIDLR